MLTQLAYRCFRLVLICLVAGLGYVIVYLPLMSLLFNKNNQFILIIFLTIEGLAIWTAWRFAKTADRRLPVSIPGRTS